MLLHQPPFTDESQIWCAIADPRRTLTWQIFVSIGLFCRPLPAKNPNFCSFFGIWYLVVSPIGRSLRKLIRRPASADRTVHRQLQATGQPVSQTQASDAMTSQLPCYEATCVQRRCFQCGSVPLRSDIKGMELPPANKLIPLERQLTVLQLCS